MTITIARLLAGFLLLISVTSSNAIPINSISSGLQSRSDGNTTSWIAGLVTHYDPANNPDPPASGNQKYRINKDGAASNPSVFGSGVNHITLFTEEYYYFVLHWMHTSGYPASYIGEMGVDSTFDFPTPSMEFPWHKAFSEKSWSSRKSFARWVALRHSGKRSGYLLAQSTPVAVPEGGVSAYLLGGSLIGLGALRKLLKMQGHGL